MGSLYQRIHGQDHEACDPADCDEALRRALPEPCFCHGPWSHDAPEDRPETTLQREHSIGSEGCERGYTLSPFTRRALAGTLPAKVVR